MLYSKSEARSVLGFMLLFLLLFSVFKTGFVSAGMIKQPVKGNFREKGCIVAQAAGT